jgi:hypothetical protein
MMDVYPIIMMDRIDIGSILLKLSAITNSLKTKAMALVINNEILSLPAS